MATGIETRIYEGLNSWLAVLTLTPVVPIAWPNLPAAPNGPYLRPWLLPEPTEALTLSADGPNDYKGTYQVSAFWPVGTGTTRILEAASAIVLHFKRGTSITREGIRMWVDAPPSLGPMIQEPDIFQLPVSVPYRAFISNA